MKTATRGRLVWAALLVGLAAGCDGARDHRQVLRDQIEALRETEKILAEIGDAQSMAAARARLERNQQWFADISERGRELERPTEDMAASLRNEAAELQAVLTRVQEHVRRIQSLSGGPAFLRSFEGGAGFLRDVP